MRVAFTLAMMLTATAAKTQTCAAPPYTDAASPELAQLLSRALPVVSDYPSLAEALREAEPFLCIGGQTYAALGFFRTGQQPRGDRWRPFP